jgi:hypothetical protein
MANVISLNLLPFDRGFIGKMRAELRAEIAKSAPVCKTSLEMSAWKSSSSKYSPPGGLLGDLEPDFPRVQQQFLK